jgi:predicted nucleic acid-binding protein
MKSSQKLPAVEQWVINASPVIALARVGQVELLARLPKKAILPRAVEEELLRGPEDDPARRSVESGMFKVVDTPVPRPEIMVWDLGKGETAVLSYALAHPKWVAVLDDGVARRCARSFSIKITGTLAIVLLAKRAGLIASAAQVLHD